MQVVPKSGLRQILEDVSRVKADGGTTLNLSIGNPAHIDELAKVWRDIAHRAVDAEFSRAFGEYGSAGGHAGLVKQLISYFDRTLGWSIGPENIVVAPGSQSLCDLAVKTFCGTDKPLVLPFLPDYAGYMSLGGNSIPTIGISSKLRQTSPRRFSYFPDFPEIGRVGAAGLFLYSDPANPSTSSLSPQHRDQLIKIADSIDSLVVVDNAYGAPFPFVATPQAKPIFHPRVINLFSCSKMGLPGARLGFAVGPADQIGLLNNAVSNSVLQAPGLPQMMLSEAISSSLLDEQLTKMIAPHYQEKRAHALRLLDQTFPEHIPWSVCDAPDGMFLWIQVDSQEFDDLSFYQNAQDAGVFITPGRFFFSDSHKHNKDTHKFIRVSLSAPIKELTDGINILSSVLGQFDAANQAFCRQGISG